MNRKERRRLKKLSQQTHGTGTQRAPPGIGQVWPSYATNGETPYGGSGADAPTPALLQQAFSFHQAGRLREALGLYQHVLTAQPNHPDALNLGGVAAFELGDGDRAVKLVQAAIACKPDHVDAHNNLGNMLKALGRLDEAETAYRRALEIEPDYADAHYNLGILLEALGRLDEAEAAYRRALEIKPDFAEAHFNLGNVLPALGKLDEAATAYRRALEISPDHAGAHNNLGNALKELGKFDEAEGAYRRALEIKPNHADAHYNLGIVLQELGKLDDAIAAYHSALDIKPDYVGVHVNLGIVLQELGKLDEAVAAFERAIAIEPDYAQAHANLGDVLLERGDPRAAVEVCDAYLKAHPGDRCVLAFKVFALQELGERDAARSLADFDRLVRATRFEAPPSFASLADFNAALVRHVCAHPTLVFAPTSHATRLGKHTGELLVEPKGPIAVLDGMIRGAVEVYQRSPAADPPDPFLAKPPQRWRLSGWGVVLEAQGHQIPHIHPSAWLSGVYYVKLPDIVGMPGQRQAGWIEFGRPPEHLHCTVEPDVRAVQPEEGLMLLFPSYFYHRTVPFKTAGTRISIAFDVLPED